MVAAQVVDPQAAQPAVTLAVGPRVEIPPLIRISLQGQKTPPTICPMTTSTMLLLAMCSKKKVILAKQARKVCKGPSGGFSIITGNGAPADADGNWNINVFGCAPKSCQPSN